MDNNRKIQISNILLIVILCVLTNFITIMCMNYFNKSPTSQNQTVNINQEPYQKKININKASKEELMSIKGVGEKISQSIIDNRPYSSVWDLTKIKGISSERIKELQEVLEI